MATPSLFRPIQYMGSKLNLAHLIADNICNGCTNGVILDTFSGTSVVGQEFAKRGWKVITSDALEFCNTMSRATLGIGKKSDEKLLREWDAVQKTADNIELPSKWNLLLLEEQRLIDAGDGGSLLALEGNYPRRTTEVPESNKGESENIWRITEVFAELILVSSNA